MVEPYVLACRKYLEDSPAAKAERFKEFARFVREQRPQPNKRPHSNEGLAVALRAYWPKGVPSLPNDTTEANRDLALYLTELGRGTKTFLEPILIWLWTEKRGEVRSHFKDVNFGSADETARKASRTLIARTGDSSLGVTHILSSAKKQITLVAQNHWWFTLPERAEEMWKNIETALRRGVSIDIAAMHPSVRPTAVTDNTVPDAVALWSIYQKAPEFADHLKGCWRTLKFWNEKYIGIQDGAENLARFRVFGAYFEPLTITLVDPDEDDGYVVLSFRTHDAKSSTRPQFVLYKATEAVAFNYYRDGVTASLPLQNWKELNSFA